MNITQRLQKLDPTLKQHNEGHWDEPFNSDAPGFSSFNDGGVEIEVGELLYSLVRLIKPENILETGLYSAISTMYMAQALRENGKGKIDTVEFEIKHVVRSRTRLEKLGLIDFVTIHHTDARAFLPAPGIRYELILLDTEPQTRFEELLKFYDNLAPGGFLFIHDLHRHMHQISNADHNFAWPFGPIPDAMRELVRDGKLRPFHFSTPRGLTGFYRVAESDYKW